ncbi:hypothetical protein [Prescottella equi]|uniref:hypothetical protein n=1 Tax=Rhodococcus hoagii TaxID=43767 RepID=UPI000A1197CF|nr:hypothetical protein [Prescottella equi]ORL15411.1 hypothetical protein A6I85_05915 [Prescottella equi]
MAATAPRKKTVAKKVVETDNVNKDDFTFATEAGETINMPSFATLKPGTIRKARKAVDDLDRTFIFIETMVPDDATLEIIDNLSPEEFGDFFQAWIDDSGVSEGESTAS